MVRVMVRVRVRVRVRDTFWAAARSRLELCVM